MSRLVVRERSAEAVRLADDVIALMRANLVRRYPADSEPEIEERLQAWLLDRPMDAPGRVVPQAFP